MSLPFLSCALLAISLLTNFSVEAIKKFLDESNASYSSNLLAAIISIVTALITSVLYIIANGIQFNLLVGIEIVVLMYLSFLTSTIGYDKVIQMIKQISIAKSDKEE